MINGSNCDRKSELSGILTKPINPRELDGSFHYIDSNHYRVFFKEKNRKHNFIIKFCLDIRLINILYIFRKYFF